MSDHGSDDTPLCLATLEQISDELGRRSEASLILVAEREMIGSGAIFEHMEQGSWITLMGLVRAYVALSERRISECDERGNRLCDHDPED